MTKLKDDVYFISRLSLAALSGGIAYFAYPRPGWWPLIFLVVAGFQIAVSKTTYPRALAIGFVFGFTFFASQVWWISQYLGAEPLVALATLEALFVSAAALLWVYLERHLKHPFALALAFASVWTAREWFSTHFPYGGFPWSRLAMSQSNSPLAGWVFFGGLSLLTFVLALTTSLAVFYLPKLRVESSRRSSAMLLVGALAVLVIVPNLTWSSPSIGKLKVAGIQGNANAGLFANNTPGTILGNHLKVTHDFLKSDQRRGVQLVVWPENASDINPQDNFQVAQTLQTLIDQKLRVPLLFGTLTQFNGQMFNSTLLWQPDLGITDQYDKKRPIPFAEYVPDRAFWNALAPDLIGLIYRGYTFGTRDPIYEVHGARLGDLICFEIAIDDIIQNINDAGANAIVSQSNNADFGHSDEAYQQYALMKLRAIETGLPIINVSTTGPSGAFDGRGNQIAFTDAFQARYFVANLPLTSSTTPAMGYGRYFDLANVTLLTAGILLVEIRRRRTKASQRRGEL